MTDYTVTVYSKANCPQCDATKRALQNKGIGFNAVDLTVDAEALEKVRGLGYAAAPVVIAGDDHWSGFRPDKISALAAQDKTTYAHCDRQGVISYTDNADESGLICLGSGVGQDFKDKVEVLARHAYQGGVLLVPGVPEAVDDKAALAAVTRFSDHLKVRLSGDPRPVPVARKPSGGGMGM